MSVISFSKARHSQKMASFLNRLQGSLQISTIEMCDILKTTELEYQNVLKKRGHLDINQFAALADHFHFSIERFENESINFQALHESYHKGNLILPEEYLVGARSKKQLIIAVLHYIQNHYGISHMYKVMDYFHLSEQIFSDPHGKINWVFFEEVLNYALCSGLNARDIFQIGVSSVKVNPCSWFGVELSVQNSARELFEYYFSYLVRHIEENNTYVITKMNDHFCEVESREKPEMLDIFERKHIGGSGRCIYRAGALSAATRYIGLPFAEVTETECSHRGGSVCRFQINYEHSSHVSKKQGRKYAF